MSAALRKRLAVNIRRLRKEQGMTQEQLAEAADIEARYVSKLESSAGRNVRLGTLCKLANALAVAPADLLRAPPRR